MSADVAMTDFLSRWKLGYRGPVAAVIPSMATGRAANAPTGLLLKRGGW